ACYALHIRHPRAHILPSLTATCQVCTVALKAGLSTYNRFACRALDTPDSDPAQTDADIMGVTRQAPAPITDGLVLELETEGQKEGEDTLEKRLPIAQQLKVRGFISKIDGNGAVFSCLFGSFPHVSPPGSQVVRAHKGQWGEMREISRVV